MASSSTMQVTAQDVAPPSAASGKDLCLLSLDGGGVRGISSLQIIKQLMERIDIKNPPKPCDYFDMIGGTSTGGLIAIMLGRLRMSVDDCLKAYTELAEKVFTRQHYLPIRLRNGQMQARFDTAALEAGIKKIIRDQNMDEDALFKDEKVDDIGGCKTFVCTTSKETGQIVILSNYHSLRRGTDLLNVTRIWEAARATSAATTFFAPIEFGDTGFVDGATGANNPISMLWTEAKDFWCQGDSWQLSKRIQCLVSVGTGMPSLMPFGGDPISLGQTLLQIATETEATAQQFQRDHSDLDDNKRLFRFNVLRGLEKIGLEDAAQKRTIIAATREYLQTQSIYKELEHCSNNLAEREWDSKIQSLASNAYSAATEHMLSLTNYAQAMEDIPEVYQWFTHSPEYCAWRAGSSSSMLCFMAPAGSGKTLLTENIILRHDLGINAVHISCQRIAGTTISRARMPSSKAFQSSKLTESTLETMDAIQEDEAVRNQSEKTQMLDPVELRSHSTGVNARPVKSLKRVVVHNFPMATLVRSMLGQLIYNEPSLIHFVKLATCQWGLEGLNIRRNLFSDSQLSEAGLEGLWKLLCYVLQQVDGTETLLTVDGLHEVNLSSRTALLKKLQWMCRQQRATPLRVLVTSRPDQDTSKALQGVAIVDEVAELSDCLQSLYYKEIHQRRDRVAHSRSGTNQWIWRHWAYIKWSKQPSDILWIEGKAGSGKSTLARAIQTELLAANSRKPKGAVEATVVGFQSPLITDHFYSARQLVTGVSHEMMLRSLLYQILKVDSSLFASIQGLYRKLRKSATGVVLWKWTDLESAFQCLRQAQTTRRDIFCILDAMDESQSDDKNEKCRTKVLALLQGLSDKGNKSRSSTGPKFKFLVLSRPAREIALELSGCYKIRLERENRKDIVILINAGLQELRALVDRDHLHSDLPSDGNSDSDTESTSRPQDFSQVPNNVYEQKERQKAKEAETRELDEIKQYLLDHVDGVVLWALLVLDALKAHVEKGLYTLQHLKDELRKLPVDLEDLYQHMVDELERKHEPAHLKMARSLMLWVSFAQRPLTIDELREAVAMSSMEDGAGFEALCQSRMHPHSASQFWLSILGLCGPLLEVVRPEVAISAKSRDKGGNVASTDTLQLIHQTVKDFLVSPKASSVQIGAADSSRISQTAVNYFHLIMPISGFPADAVNAWTPILYCKFVDELKNRPLLGYSFDEIKIRSSAYGNLSRMNWGPKTGQMSLLFEDKASYSSKDKSDLGASLGHDFRTKCFVAACERGYPQVARLLLWLSHDGQTSSHDKMVQQSLFRAAEAGNLPTAALLRNHPMFSKKDQFNSGYDCMQEAVLIAIRRENCQMLHCLLDKFSGRISNWGYPLHLAAMKDNVDIVEFLIWKIVNVNCLNDRQQTPLDLALSQKCTSVVKLLSSKGALTSSDYHKGIEARGAQRKLELKLAEETRMERVHGWESSSDDDDGFRPGLRKKALLDISKVQHLQPEVPSEIVHRARFEAKRDNVKEAHSTLHGVFQLPTSFFASALQPLPAFRDAEASSVSSRQSALYNLPPDNGIFVSSKTTPAAASTSTVASDPIRFATAHKASAKLTKCLQRA